jgi:hypothetical protein
VSLFIVFKDRNPDVPKKAWIVKIGNWLAY